MRRHRVARRRPLPHVILHYPMRLVCQRGGELVARVLVFPDPGVSRVSAQKIVEPVLEPSPLLTFAIFLPLLLLLRIFDISSHQV